MPIIINSSKLKKRLERFIFKTYDALPSYEIMKILKKREYFCEENLVELQTDSDFDIELRQIILSTIQINDTANLSVLSLFFDMLMDYVNILKHDIYELENFCINRDPIPMNKEEIVINYFSSLVKEGLKQEHIYSYMSSCLSELSLSKVINCPTDCFIDIFISYLHTRPLKEEGGENIILGFETDS